jgi:NTP pyrophosphatase (non-canonical NTP hydrolase)
MNFNMYQEAAIKTAVYPKEVSVLYPAIGITNEAGELLGKVKKTLRGDTLEYPKEALIDELGDVLWYAAALANDLGVTLGSVAQRNLDKLSDRDKRGVIKGNGDNR